MTHTSEAGLEMVFRNPDPRREVRNSRGLPGFRVVRRCQPPTNSTQARGLTWFHEESEPDIFRRNRV